MIETYTTLIKMEGGWSWPDSGERASMHNCVLSGSDPEGGVQYDKIKNLKPETRPYYQALIDKRDIPYVVSEVKGRLCTSVEMFISPPVSALTQKQSHS